VEYWIPADKELNIYSLKVPAVKLRALKEVPLFQWARENEVKTWNELVNAYNKKKNLPTPPSIFENCWPPSGMENLDAAFKWAINSSAIKIRDQWKFYYGTWLAGRGDTTASIKILSTTSNGFAKALLARLLKLKGDMNGARMAFESIEEPWLQLHPQIVVERDKVLRNIGTSTINERERWLSKVDALKDEWIIERRVQLLIDKGEVQKAKELLLLTPFQKIHQSYVRTGLWMQICERSNIPCSPVPAQLGEDKLARFGAYREYE
jgi:hypothetical protein